MAVPAPISILWGTVDLLLGATLAYLVWAALPARWWPVDVVGTLVAALFVVAGAAFLLRQGWARKAGLAAGAIGLGAGCVIVTALAFTASHLVGLYGPVGQGGALILAIVAALIFPYLVLLPLAQLYSLARRTSAK